MWKTSKLCFEKRLFIFDKKHSKSSRLLLSLQMCNFPCLTTLKKKVKNHPKHPLVRPKSARLVSLNGWPIPGRVE